ncbi:MarR family winged helix-turn-helix transcriptional regulator [Aquitalea magnusonii]|uniref:MarR family winged helix-turn-helix transcriptional regulator n=1 Tax=Aquitalea magnusonii TaxID=332411 RepID=UPI000B5C1EB1|nr:MarR family transcriptional regulator [Aquitalea magnusonii]
MPQSHHELTELLVAVPKAWRALLDQRLRPYGFSQATWQVLLKLGRAGEPLLQNELAARVGIEPASLVRLLDVLQADGWVTRQQDEQDRRAKRVLLTAKASQVSGELLQVADALKAELLGGLDQAELQTCIKVLAQIRHAAEQAQQ